MDNEKLIGDIKIPKLPKKAKQPKPKPKPVKKKK
jgi:hypothetical protein